MIIELGKYKDKVVKYDLDGSMNGHILINGKSGSGKTVQAQKIMLEIVKQGGTVLAFDIHQTLYENQILEKYQTDFMKYTNNLNVYHDGIVCDLLEPMVYPDGEKEYVQDAISAITDVISRTFSLKCRQQATLRQAINCVVENEGYEKKGFTAIGEELASMENQVAEGLREKLYALFVHNIFRPGKWMVEENKINIVRLGKFDLKTQELVAEILLAYIWRLANVNYFTENGLYIFVDECQDMHSGKDSALAQILSEGRKFNANLLLATQQIEQGSSSIVQQRLAQCGLILYFQPNINQASTVAKRISMNDGEGWGNVLKTLKRGEFVAAGDLIVDGKLIDRPLKVSAYEED